MEVQAKVTSFYTSSEFWWYHGWGLTGCWLVVATLAILVKKLVRGKAGAVLHGLLFFVNDAVTLFLAGGALFRVYPNLSKFQQWSLLKQAHISAGIVFTAFMALQHLGGASLLISNKPGGAHKKFGMFISFVMRSIAVFGWLLVREEQIALVCSVVAVLETIILLAINNKEAAPVKTKDNLAKYAEKPKRQ